MKATVVRAKNTLVLPVWASNAKSCCWQHSFDVRLARQSREHSVGMLGKRGMKDIPECRAQ